MRFAASVIALSATSLVCGAPVLEERAQFNDAQLLNYALTLEHLESAFYADGIKRYPQKDFAKAGFGGVFYENLKKIAKDESDHVEFIIGAMTRAGVTPVEPCTYKFGHKTVEDFLATAAIVEGVGVAAYLGAAASIMDKGYLTAAGAILTVESRHTSYLRAALKQSPFPEPFDNPLTPSEVHSLAAQFITSCPSGNPKLGLTAFPPLVLGPKTALPLKVGQTIILRTPGKKIDTKGAKIFGAFALLGGPVFVEAKQVDGGFSVQVPDKFAGQQYVSITKGRKVTDDTILAGPAILEI